MNYIILSNGNKISYLKDTLIPHSYNDQPAIIESNGTLVWFSNGKRHRGNDLPALIRKDGRREWYQDGKLHRENNQPACIFEDGSFEYFNNGMSSIAVYIDNSLFCYCRQVECGEKNNAIPKFYYVSLNNMLEKDNNLINLNYIKNREVKMSFSHTLLSSCKINNPWMEQTSFDSTIIKWNK